MKSIKNIVIALILIIAFGAFLLSNQNDAATLPQAINGTIDLRGQQDLEQVIPLDGEWEFIPDQLVDAQLFDDHTSYIVKVPNLWKKYNLNGEVVSKYTSGTYRLKVLVNDPNMIYGLKTSNIRMSNATYINGKYVGGSGKPAEDRSYTPHNNPFTTFFSPNGKQEIEILIHVANFDYASGGGIAGSVYFGDQQSILKIQNHAIFYDYVTIAAFLTMFIYFAGSYLHFKKDMQLVYFALFCLSILLYTVSHGEKVLMWVWPDLSYSIFERIQMISSVSFGLFLLLYFCGALQSITFKKVGKILKIAGILLMFTGVFPVMINSHFQSAYSIYLISVFIYIIIVQLRAVKNKVIGANYLIFSSVALFVYFIVATLNIVGNIQISMLPPLLPFICLMMISLFISKRFTDSYLKKEELTKALTKVDQLKDEFIAKTSHEFRTPLHGITAISQSILENHTQTLSNEEIEKVSLIKNIATRMSHLVNDILDHSKIQQGELKLDKTPVDLYSITHVVVEIFDYMVTKDIKIVNNIQRNQFVVADENRLRQILYNLIDNAVKYTDQGKVEISAQLQNGFVKIDISDTGIGISQENMINLFQPFQQFGNAMEGTGLGLSIVKQLVELQGGKIKVHSVVGQGTTFSVTLPVASPVELRQKSSASPYFSNAAPIHLPIPYHVEKQGKKILIADDDHVNLKVLIDTLAVENYYIIAVDNGQAVLDAMDKHPDIELVVLDIMMPGFSGYEVSQNLRKSYGLADLPILMLTAAITPEDMIAAFHSGANDFLHKPFVAEELKTRIRNLILMKESAIEKTNMEVAFLQAQIKPHFIYNVLNTILSLSYLDIEKSRMLITDFATFLRGSFAFENTNSLVPFDKELALVESYLNLQCTRFPGQIDWELHMEEELHCFIPPLLLQPLVENAILHGLKNKPGGGTINLSVEKMGDLLHLTLHDNGVGMSAEKLLEIAGEQKSLKQGIGLHNIRKRLKYYEGASIKLESAETEGTTVKITFPILHTTKEVNQVAKSSTNG